MWNSRAPAPLPRNATEHLASLPESSGVVNGGCADDVWSLPFFVGSAEMACPKFSGAGRGLSHRRVFDVCNVGFDALR